MSVSFGHGLELTYFRVQKQRSNGSWSAVSMMHKDARYRFKVTFKDIVNVKKHKKHSHLATGFVVLDEAGYAAFYKSSAYTGSPSSRAVDLEYTRIIRGKTHTWYFYFIWKAPVDVPLPPPGARIRVELYTANYLGKPGKSVPPFIS